MHAAPTAGAPEPRRVRAMFDGIAGRYDLLNHVLSMQMDRLWRRRAARIVRDRVRAASATGGATPRILDLCTGTGDLLLAHRKWSVGASLFGGDFSLEMLKHAREKDRTLRLVGTDALALPYRDAKFDAVTVAFGVRNLEDRGRGFQEMRRVLRPGGVALVLEFSPAPKNLFGAAYRVYSQHVLPRIAGLIAANKAAYKYLPDSVARFPDVHGLRDELVAAGFAPVDFERLAFGTVAIHVATRSA